MAKKWVCAWVALITSFTLMGCNRDSDQSSSPKNTENDTNQSLTPTPMNNRSHSNPNNIGTNMSYVNKTTSKDGKAIYTTKYPASLGVIVNKKIYLPKTYVPKNLVYPNTSFLFKEKIEKRKLRKEAAVALERMFAAAKKDKVYLSGVSAYRSYATQAAVFNRYVKRDGYEKARTYSAIPGTSEHQTGLSIDVSGSSGKCAAASCFATTKEAKWLDKNSANFGYIIRYPKGKEYVTGYKYEPWHIRYVGTAVAKEMKKRNLTLEEYYGVFPILKK
ncbi:M15 family metallopeptidase [Neobacillus bataviensis]|uniref:M15 family metallopeptidase n=1 Tax=Neobacillus bataviensis TaxID=220685 RepID=UPI001CBD7996|nr:M15 family metallopeptidase [Neobacillus bataviensis]